MKLMFRILRDLVVGEVHSAEQLAVRHGLTRAAVIQAMQEARDYGVQIRAVRGRGYELTSKIDWLDADRVAQVMGMRAAQCQLSICDEVDSTNDTILSVQGAPAGRIIAVSAELQSGGRGRRGRRWNSGIGNAVTFSLLFQVRQRLAMLSASSLVAGVGMVRAMQELKAHDVTLKWPNDLVSGAGKIGGMLIESRPERGPGVIVVGIGVNVHMPDALKAVIDQPVSDLRTLGVVVDRSTILGVCLRHVMAVVEQFETEGFARLRQEWTTHAAFVAQPVVLSHSNGERETGILAGIAEDGALLLTTPQGQKKIYVGEISLRPIAST